MNPFLQAQKRAQRANEDEAVRRAYEHHRLLRQLLGSRFPLTEEVLDALDWHAAERECRTIECQGRFS